MKRKFFTPLTYSLFLLGFHIEALCQGAGVNAPVIELLIQGITVVDVENDTLLANYDVGISGEKITYLQPERETPWENVVQIVDGRGKFLIPSLWDMHAHPLNIDELKLYVANGVLGIRAMWGFSHYLDWRRSIANDSIIGPDIISAGKIMEGTPPRKFGQVVDTAGRAIVDTPEDVIKALDEQERVGFDFVKVYNNMPADAYDKLIEEAKKRNIVVCGHVPFEVGLAKAMVSQRSIEHLRGYIQILVNEDAPIKPDVDFRSRELSWEFIDENKMDSLARATAQSGVYSCPTLSVADMLSPQDTMIKLLSRPQMIYVPSHLQDFMRNRKGMLKVLNNFSDEDYQKINSLYPKKQKLVKALSDHGSLILAGTDTFGFNAPGYSLHDELLKLAECGLDPYQVLRAASLNPASYFEREDAQGSIAAGKEANMILLDRDPIKDIKNTKAIRGVIQRGKIYNRTSLDNLLSSCVIE